MIKIALMVCAALMLLASSATAQKPSPVGHCAADRMRLCAGIEPTRANLRACFRKHIHELSDACLLGLAKLSAVDKTCRERLSRACARCSPGRASSSFALGLLPPNWTIIAKLLLVARSRLKSGDDCGPLGYRRAGFRAPRAFAYLFLSFI